MTHLHIHHHGDYRTSPIVFILSEHIAMYDNLPYGSNLAKIGNSKWPPGGSLSKKTMYICICSGFYKHGQILSKFVMQVSIGYVIIEDENRVKKLKIPPN